MKEPIGVIALLTDVGESEPYSASIKGVILSLCLNACIVKISNSVPSFDLKEAAYILLVSYKFFPPGTIFVVVVVPGVGVLERPLLIITRNYYFIGPDNGVLIPAVKDDGIEKILLLDKDSCLKENNSQTFHGRDIYAPIAAKLSCSGSIDGLGTLLDEKNVVDFNIELTHRSSIEYVEIKVLHIDKYGNIILSEYFDDFAIDFEFIKGVKVKVYSNNREAVAVLEESFSYVPEGSLILYKNSYGLVELAVNQGSAQKLLQVHRGDVVRIHRPR